MSLKLVLRRIAQKEIADAIIWYETQQSGVGAEFAATIKQTFESILRMPERFPIAHMDARCAKVGKFPYCVYFRIKPKRIVVTAVFHTSRDPSGWKDRS